MMKRLLWGIITREGGQILPLVLVLLAVGGLVIAPTLAYSSTVLGAVRANQQRINQFYAADAGLTEALWRIPSDFGNASLPKTPGGSWTYGDASHPPILASINSGQTLAVTITCITFGPTLVSYQITSTAQASDNSSSTTVSAYNEGAPIFFQNAVVAGGTIDNKGFIDGDVYGTVTGGGTVDGYEHPPYEGSWPAEQTFEDFYRPQSSYPTNKGDTIDVSIIGSIPPWYRNADLTIKNTGAAGTEAMLNGTVYVLGDLLIGQSAQAFTLNMNGNTIYAMGTAQIGGKTTIKGSGVIISLGNMLFKPNLNSSDADFLFVMSVYGRNTFQPSGNFYGAAAGGSGGISITIQPGNTLKLTDVPDSGLNFPLTDPTTGELTCQLAWSISNWSSSR